MGRVTKISSEVEIVEDYLDGKIRIINKSIELGVSTISIWKWIQKYKTFVAHGLIRNKKNTVYKSYIKLKTVKDYLSDYEYVYAIIFNLQVF